MKLVELIPEPGNLWIEGAPRLRGRRDAAWLDLRSADLGGATPVRGRSLRRVNEGSRIYLPPGVPELGEEILASGSDVRPGTLRHRLVGPAETDEIPDGGTSVFDVLEAVLERDWKAFEALPRGEIVVWPLISGVTDTSDVVEAGIDRLATRAPAAVVPLTARLSGAAGRHLSERLGEAAFDAVFHGRSADRRGFAKQCAAAGLDFLPPRRLGHRGARGRMTLGSLVATELSLIADLAIECGESEARAQRYYRAARWFRETTRDVAALHRESNLGILPWVDERIEAVIDELVEAPDRATRALRRLEAGYAGLH